MNIYLYIFGPIVFAIYVLIFIQINMLHKMYKKLDKKTEKLVD